MRNRFIFLAVLCFTLSHWAFAAGPADESLASGQQALERGDKDEALRLADKTVDADPKSAAGYVFRAAVRDARHEFDKAVLDFASAIALSPEATALYQRRGEDFFRLGQFKESVADFDKVIELEPRRAPYHWQRGISLYYAGEFDRGARQFELHKTVNPEDVENAVWHFLCVARLSGVEKARQSLIPIHDDGRVPMMQVFDLFAGKATEQTVMDAVKAGDPARGELNQRLFYAHLYLGLFDEATGKVDAAKDHILLAAEKYAEDDYMGDVARVHAKVMKKNAGGPQSRPQTRPAASRADLPAKAKAVLDMLEERRINGEPDTPDVVELYCTWSRRLALTRCDAARTREEKIAALGEHLQRMNDRIFSWLHTSDVGPNPFPLQRAIAEYYAAEAEVMIDDVKK